MKFTTNLPKSVAEQNSDSFFAPYEGACLISITEPGKKKADIDPKDWLEILRMEFWDVTEPTRHTLFLAGDSTEIEEARPINEEQAKEIAAFIRKNWDRNILVHCRAGVSRSAAVARVLVELGWDYKLVHHDMSQYNVTVFNLLKRQFPELLPLGAENT